jgi:hypothetical protein
MAAGPGTFISSVLQNLGLSESQIWPGPGSGLGLYPKFSMDGSESFPKPTDDTIFLFSSEPFPFSKKKAELELLGRPSLIVDGECFSWFGIRSLRFLDRN